LIRNPAAAKVRIHTSGAIFPTGSEAVLRCEASGNPPMTVHWKRFDQLIESHQQMDRFQLSSVASDGRDFLDLNISRVEADDGGMYVCQAANLYGSDATDIRLIVQGKSNVNAVVQTAQSSSEFNFVCVLSLLKNFPGLLANFS
jgi:hypothetical protein